MKLRNWATLGGVTLGALGIGLAIKSFLPQRFPKEPVGAGAVLGGEGAIVATRRTLPDTSTFPEVDVTILRCGSTTLPEWVAVRGASLFTSCVNAHSAVLVRHPRATFLYDTGLCNDTYLYLVDQSFLFRKTLGKIVLERSLASHLKHLGLRAGDIDFALISHLHWDHVSGVPDLPGVPIRINRVEYEAARLGLLDAFHGLVRQLLCDNPVEFFDCAGPGYAGFRSSYDLFGDGSIVLVPLPGHTAGNTGMFINRSNGSPLFLLGDAVWVSQNYLRPATMHPLIWFLLTSDDATARQTLLELHYFSRQHPEIPLIAMHDAAMQEKFMALEHPRMTTARMKE